MMFDPEENQIVPSKEGEKNEFQRDMAAWYLNMLHKLSIENPDKFFVDQLSTIYVWHGEGRFEPGKPNYFGTSAYKQLESHFCSTYIAWLVRGEDLPEPAKGISALLRDVYESPAAVTGATLDAKIAGVFRNMVSIEGETKSTVFGSSTTDMNKKRSSKNTSIENGGLFSKFPLKMLSWRTDFLGRLRVALSPLASLPILNALVDEPNDGFFLRGISYVLEEVSDGYYNDSLSILMAFFIAWVSSGVVELTIKWVVQGSGKLD